MSITDIAASGMGASVQAYRVSANNIANSQTQGFQASRAVFSETYVAQSGSSANGLRDQEGQGVGVRVETPAQGDPQAPSNVDLTGEMAALLQNGQLFKANAAVAKGSDFMLETLLSMKS